MKSICTSCNASIQFRWTLNGKRMPLDLEPVAAAPGTYRLDGEHGCVAASPMDDPPGTLYYECHESTCSMADLTTTTKGINR